MTCCKRCGREIGFRKLPSGKWMPTEIDGSDHWDACSATVNLTAPKGRVDTRSSPVIVGEKYVYTPNPDPSLPPWW